jgi:hypothetical protein
VRFTDGAEVGEERNLHLYRESETGGPGCRPSVYC